MPRPDGKTETLGIDVLDEPCLNPEDPNILKMKWQSENGGANTTGEDEEVTSIAQADKNPKEVTRWIENITALQDGKPMANVNYTKAMPEMDQLMEEWPAEMEQLLR